MLRPKSTVQHLQSFIFSTKLWTRTAAAVVWKKFHETLLQGFLINQIDRINNRKQRLKTKQNSCRVNNYQHNVQWSFRHWKKFHKTTICRWISLHERKSLLQAEIYTGFGSGRFCWTLQCQRKFSTVWGVRSRDTYLRFMTGECVKTWQSDRKTAIAHATSD